MLFTIRPGIVRLGHNAPIRALVFDGANRRLRFRGAQGLLLLIRFVNFGLSDNRKKIMEMLILDREVSNMSLLYVSSKDYIVAISRRAS